LCGVGSEIVNAYVLLQERNALGVNRLDFRFRIMAVMLFVCLHNYSNAV
jgi:hypothetical protein